MYISPVCVCDIFMSANNAHTKVSSANAKAKTIYVQIATTTAL